MENVRLDPARRTPAQSRDWDRPATGPRHHFEFQKFHITNTRAAHNDTDTVSLALKDDGAQPARVLIKHLGEVNNGDDLVQLKIGPIVFQGTEQVRLVTTVLQSVTPSGPTPGPGPRFMPSRRGMADSGGRRNGGC
jgi:hypothetical protein